MFSFFRYLQGVFLWKSIYICLIIITFSKSLTLRFYQNCFLLNFQIPNELIMVNVYFKYMVVSLIDNKIIQIIKMEAHDIWRFV